MESRKVLVVEDDIEISRSIEIYLVNQGYKVLKAYDGEEAIDIFFNQGADLIIMDLMIPKLNGEEAIIKIRETSFVPIIILSAKSEDFDKIMGLNIGADDYVTKPFNPIELMARVNSGIRRYYNYGAGKIPDDSKEIVIGSVVLNTAEKTIYIDGENISLTSIEYKILELLMKNPGRIFSIEEIYERVWNEPAYDAKTVTVHIRRIREKIEIDPRHPMYLQVAWGLGYKFVSPQRRQ